MAKWRERHARKLAKKAKHDPTPTEQSMLDIIPTADDMRFGFGDEAR